MTDLSSRLAAKDCAAAAVSTAVPAFIGYTAGGPAASKDPKVARIDDGHDLWVLQAGNDFDFALETTFGSGA